MGFTSLLNDGHTLTSSPVCGPCSLETGAPPWLSNAPTSAARCSRVCSPTLAFPVPPTPVSLLLPHLNSWAQFTTLETFRIKQWKRLSKKKRKKEKDYPYSWGCGKWYSFGRQSGSTQKMRKAYTFQQNHPTPRNLSCKCIWASAQSSISKMFGAELLIVVTDYKEQERTSIGWLRFLTVFILRCFFLMLCWNLLLGPRFSSLG